MRLKYSLWGFTWFLIALIQMTWVEQLKITATALNYNIIGYIWLLNYIMILLTFLFPITIILDYTATKKEQKEKRLRDETYLLIKEIEDLKKRLEQK